MNTPLVDREGRDAVPRTRPGAVRVGPPVERPSRRIGRRGAWMVLAGVAAAAVVLVGAAVLIDSNGGESDLTAGPPIELSLGDGAALASCIQFDVELLDQFSALALGGTATAVDDDRVTLTVDRWYRGGDAATVVLTTPAPAAPSLIAGFDFEVGQQYLISAQEGAVNYCGFSGPAWPELTAAFEAAFGG